MAESLQQQENNRLANGRFPKGVSGNPNGRPKGNHSESISNLLRKRLDELAPGTTKTYKEMIVDAWLLELVNRKDKSHIAALREALNRLEGKPKESIEVSGNVEKPITLKVVYDDGDKN